VSSSANTPQVLKVTGLDVFVELRVDGNTLREEDLRGKPAPDSWLYAAKQLGLEPSQCAVFEDATAGVESGKAGGFGVVVGVDRVDHAKALKEHGADIVVQDLAELL
jgi:beta-phosphoglucomutase-like phosphatase (HAD superfamily)